MARAPDEGSGKVMFASWLGLFHSIYLPTYHRPYGLLFCIFLARVFFRYKALPKRGQLMRRTHAHTAQLVCSFHLFSVSSLFVASRKPPHEGALMSPDSPPHRRRRFLLSCYLRRCRLLTFFTMSAATANARAHTHRGCGFFSCVCFFMRVLFFSLSPLIFLGRCSVVL